MPDINNNLDLSKIYNLNGNPNTQNLENMPSEMNMFGYDFFSKDDIEKEELKNKSKNIDREKNNGRCFGNRECSTNQP